MRVCSIFYTVCCDSLFLSSDLVTLVTTGGAIQKLASRQHRFPPHVPLEVGRWCTRVGQTCVPLARVVGTPRKRLTRSRVHQAVESLVPPFLEERDSSELLLFSV